jgi:two-component system CheB/CheR fusion protein
VLANEQGNILYISGHTGKYLEPAAGKANWNVFAMARDGIRYELTGAFQKALRQEGPVTVHGLQVETNDGQQLVDLSIEKLAASEPLAGLLMIVFTAFAAPVATTAARRVAASRARSPRVTELERELHQTRAELQNTREQMQTSQEELKSTNEEMQSTNEELTASKEELHSLNEELQTVNAELQGRLSELSRSNRNELPAARQHPRLTHGKAPPKSTI